MRRVVAILILGLAMLPAICQTVPAKWTMGVVTAVTPHEERGTADKTKPKYDVSVAVGDTIYVVLYSPPAGSNAIEYRVGVDKPVLVGKTTLTFNDWQGNPMKLPILNRMAASATKSRNK
jgi:hypothetical protein